MSLVQTVCDFCARPARPGGSDAFHKNQFLATRWGRILAHGSTLEDLVRTLRERRIDETRVVIEYAEPPAAARVF